MKEGIHFDLDELTRIRKKLGSNIYARVGILGSDASEDHAQAKTVYDTKSGKPSRTSGSSGGVTNALVGFVHEFGSLENNIPVRSFLRLPLMEKKKEIVKFFASGAMKKLIEEGDVVRIFQLLGVKAEQIVQRAFETQGFGHWPSIKPQTAERKGSTAILIDSAQLRGAVSSDVKMK